MFIFNSYYCPEYGLALWNHASTFKSNIFKTFEIAYSNALKRMSGVPTYASSHITAERCQQLLLRHLTALIQARFLKRIIRSQNPLIKYNYYNLVNGYAIKSIVEMFTSKYEINILQEDMDVILSRIVWVQKHENRSGPCLFYGY